MAHVGALHFVGDIECIIIHELDQSLKTCFLCNDTGSCGLRLLLLWFSVDLVL